MARPVSRGEAVRRSQERAKGEERSRKVRLAFLIVLGTAAVVFVILTVALWSPFVRAVRHQRLQASVEQFMSAGGEKGPEVEPHLKGKVVVIDRRRGALDPVQSQLPDEIRAYGAAEVGTVVWLEWDIVPTASGSGHYSTCKITLVDRESNRIVGEQTLTGASSPVSKGSRYVPPGQVTAVRAEAQVVSYLQGLPRR